MKRNSSTDNMLKHSPILMERHSKKQQEPQNVKNTGSIVKRYTVEEYLEKQVGKNKIF